MHLTCLRTALVVLLSLLAAPPVSTLPVAAAAAGTAAADAAAQPDCERPPLRFTFALIKKRPDLTYDQFYDYWLNVHGPKVVKWVVKHNIPTYNQIHTRPELKQKLAPTTPLPYDGVVEFELFSWEQWERAQADPYLAQVIVPDTYNFIDQSPTGVSSTNATTTLGAPKTLVAKGKAVKDP